MKKILISFVIMLTFIMQSFTLLPGQTPILLRLESGPNSGGVYPKPTKSDPNIEPPINVYLNESSDSLLLYSPTELSCSYNIYDVDELEVCNGSVAFSEQGEGFIYLGTLDDGTYTISFEVDTLVYVGEFEKN